MHVEFDFEALDPNNRLFVTWIPQKAQARLVNSPTNTGSLKVRLRSAGPVGHVNFADQRTDDGDPRISLDLPRDGSPVDFWFGGRFGSPSKDVDDAKIEALGPGTTGVLASKELMVRVRKNAEELETRERDRFLDAMARLNNSGTGRFRDFRSMHVSSALAEAHGNAGFLPWHRAYLLDLERELQVEDATVALPYWRFDRAAPKLFSRRFMGVPNSVGRVQFSAGHPFLNWTTDNAVGIVRPMNFQPGNAPSGIRSETQTINLGGQPPNATYVAFRRMERNPHGRAHTRFSVGPRRGFISRTSTAPRDPLFFLLHCNVDRLWAKWQWLRGREDPSKVSSFSPGSPQRIGHRLNDTMWPWNQSTTPPRPTTPAPGGQFPSSPFTNRPGNKPQVRDMIDYYGVINPGQLGFAYDDVPFQL